MPGNRTRSRYKRVRKGFKGSPWWESKPGNIDDVPRPSSTSTPRGRKSNEEAHMPMDLGEEVSPLSRKASVSERKLDAHNIAPTKSLCDGESEEPQPFLVQNCDGPDGYRLIDMACFGNAIESAHKCHKGKLSKYFTITAFCHITV